MCNPNRGKAAKGIMYVTMMPVDTFRVYAVWLTALYSYSQVIDHRCSG